MGLPNEGSYCGNLLCSNHYLFFFSLYIEGFACTPLPGITHYLLVSIKPPLLPFPFISTFYPLAFPFLFRDDRDPEGNDFPTFLPEISDDLVQDTKQKRLEDARGTNKKTTDINPQ